MEAGGIEPPSRDNANGGLYMRSRCFNLGRRDERRHPARKPSRLSLAATPTAERGGQPAALAANVTRASRRAEVVFN